MQLSIRIPFGELYFSFLSFFNIIFKCLFFFDQKSENSVL